MRFLITALLLCAGCAGQNRSTLVVSIEQDVDLNQSLAEVPPAKIKVEYRLENTYNR